MLFVLCLATRQKGCRVAFRPLARPAASAPPSDLVHSHGASRLSACATDCFCTHQPQPVNFAHSHPAVVVLVCASSASCHSLNRTALSLLERSPHQIIVRYNTQRRTKLWWRNRGKRRRCTVNGCASLIFSGENITCCRSIGMLRRAHSPQHCPIANKDPRASPHSRPRIVPDTSVSSPALGPLCVPQRDEFSGHRSQF